MFHCMKLNMFICITSMCYRAVLLKLVTYYQDLKISKDFQSFLLYLYAPVHE